MKRIKWVSSFAVVFVLLGSAKAQEMNHQYRERISGSAAPSSFDINGDGVFKGHYVTFAGESTVGPVHGAIMVEYDLPNLGPDPACPAGTLKLPILVSAGNRALTGTQGQVFMRDDAASALFCLDPNTGAFTMSLKGAFIGGMGRFAGATGTYEYKGSGNVLLADRSGLPFGGFVLKTQGKLILPK